MYIFKIELLSKERKNERKKERKNLKNSRTSPLCLSYFFFLSLGDFFFFFFSLNLSMFLAETQLLLPLFRYESTCLHRFPTKNRYTTFFLIVFIFRKAISDTLYSTGASVKIFAFSEVEISHLGTPPPLIM